MPLPDVLFHTPGARAGGTHKPPSAAKLAHTCQLPMPKGPNLDALHPYARAICQASRTPATAVITTWCMCDYQHAELSPGGGSSTCLVRSRSRGRVKNNRRRPAAHNAPHPKLRGRNRSSALEHPALRRPSPLYCLNATPLPDVRLSGMCQLPGTGPPETTGIAPCCHDRR